MNLSFVLSYGLGTILGITIPILFVLIWPNQIFGFMGCLIGFFMDRIHR